MKKLIYKTRISLAPLMCSLQYFPYGASHSEHLSKNRDCLEVPQGAE
jgi:hypothetical protein